MKTETGVLNSGGTTGGCPESTGYAIGDAVQVIGDGVFKWFTGMIVERLDGSLVRVFINETKNCVVFDESELRKA